MSPPNHPQTESIDTPCGASLNHLDQTGRIQKAWRSNKIIVAILEKVAITKNLYHLGLSSRAPPRAPAQVVDPFEPI
ncbi:hypothetical protein [Nitrosomonas communis]|uniref:Uncharacterized protein n=1 Tax=Nitrosomonas communis TaxID=44574 RepID=A0A1I4KI73_9PROT|nr:hypothetical protein [Nitrosomonas communis]SFL78293.1 hypothetical protein SAMN05421863_100467 [Nitrosomonas communis]